MYANERAVAISSIVSPTLDHSFRFVIFGALSATRHAYDEYTLVVVVILSTHIYATRVDEFV